MLTDQTSRIARQHLETTRLLGVDFVPLAPPPDLPDMTATKKARLDDLRTRYEAEAEIPKRITGWNRIVFGDGSPDARLMFVGEAPGAEEDKHGIPFVGRAGKLLDDMIKAMGLSRQDHCYITNVLKVRPPNNRTPSVEEADLDAPFLLEQIRIIQPEAIVTLGRPAAHLLLRRTDPMGALRGHWFEFDAIPLMPTYHPAFLLRQYTPDNRRKVWSDLQQVMRHLNLR